MPIARGMGSRPSQASISFALVGEPIVSCDRAVDFASEPQSNETFFAASRLCSGRR
jgi:hypothetical protein